MNAVNSYQHTFFKQTNWNCKKKALLILVAFINFYSIQASVYNKEISLYPINSFDQVPVEIVVKGYLRFETEAIITDRNLVYINVEDLFKKLGVYCVSENNGNLLKGFIENENNHYLIDFESKQINKGEISVKSINGIVKENRAIYVETSVLNEVFGLHMLFNFRSLSIQLEAEFELPMVKKARLEKIRQNISRLQSKNEIVIDTIIGRKYHVFKGGTMDWSFGSTQSEGEKINNRFSIGLGSELLFGEASVAFNFFNQTKFDKRQLNYNWRWVDNDKKYIKQAQLGNIGVQSISLLRAPVVGVRLNNSPNTVRKATGTYTISEYTEPNWTVELYINDALVDYIQADASGLYVFKVPIVYGYTKLKLRFYGPLGEERVEEKTMNTPYTFMPKGVLEYNVAGGIVQDEQGSSFGRGEFNYGLSRIITLGGGVEYSSIIVDNPYIPFANLSFQPLSKLVINLEYAKDVSFKSLLNYYFGKSAFFELDYNKFVLNQKALLTRATQDWKASITLPYKINSISGNTKFSLNQIQYDGFIFNQLDAVISTRYKGYSANASLASNWINGQSPFNTTTIVLSRKLRNGIIIRPTFQYNITSNNIMRIRAEIEKRITKISYSASIERNVQYATNNVNFNFKYDLSFARTGFNTSYNNNQISISEDAQGSLAFGADNGVIKTGFNSALGKGGILFYPYLDLNQNGKYDKGEQKVLLSKIKVSGGKAIVSAKDSIVRVSDLNAFINYNVEFSELDLENISWRFKHKTYQILVDPNQYKKVEVPIVVMGEINGKVYLNNGEEVKEQGNITVQIYDSKGNKVDEAQSEPDGYYNFFGLKLGEYTLCINDTQLEKLEYQSIPKTHNAVIKIVVNGDIIQGVDFILSAAEKRSNEQIVPAIPITPEIKVIAEVDKVQELPQNNSVVTIPERTKTKISDVKKSPTTYEEKAVQNRKTPGSGSLDILNRYSKEFNGTIYGKVQIKDAKSTKGISGIIVNLYNNKEVKIIDVVTNDNGEYRLLGLKPGEYIISLDESKLNESGYQSITKVQTAVIIASVEGDVIKNKDFEIEIANSSSQDLNKDNNSNEVKDLMKSNPAKNPVDVSPERVEENKTSNTILEQKNILEAKINKAFSTISKVEGSFYSIQIGVFKNIVSPKQLLHLFPIYYEILPSGVVRYISGIFANFADAEVLKRKINSVGIKDAFIVKYKAGQVDDSRKVKQQKN